MAIIGESAGGDDRRAATARAHTQSLVESIERLRDYFVALSRARRQRAPRPGVDPDAARSSSAQ